MTARKPLVLGGFLIALVASFALGRYCDGRTPVRSPPPAVAAASPAHPAKASVNSRPSDATTKLAGLFGVESLTPNADDQEEKDSGPPDIAAIDSYEDLLYEQPRLVDAAVAGLRASTPGAPGLFALGFAGDAEENVFRNEVAYLPKLLAARFGAAGRTLQLINSPYTFTHTPLATRSNLERALAGLAKRMDPANDILLLFLTSHGSPDRHLYVAMGNFPLDQLTPRDIRDALDGAGIRWRVIVISACYSGGFIPALREPHTLVITAARADRPSFGCGSDSQLTWFGKAFLVDGLNASTDFRTAFATARARIAQWERRDHETPSEPQIQEGPLMAAKLAQWRASLPANTPAVPFAPTPQRPSP